MAARTVPRALKSVNSIYGQLSQTRTYTCHSCRNALRKQAALTQSTTLNRQFTTAPPLQKKSSGSAKSNRKSPVIPSSKNETHIPDNKHSANIDAEPDAYDYTELQANIDTAIARLKDALSKTRDAGRVTAEMVEALPLELNVKGSNTEGGSAHKSKTKIGDLASVVPKGGRMMQVFAAEEAVSSSNPQLPHNNLPQPISLTLKQTKETNHISFPHPASQTPNNINPILPLQPNPTTRPNKSIVVTHPRPPRHSRNKKTSSRRSEKIIRQSEPRSEKRKR